MKKKEELNAMKEKGETVNRKLSGLTEEELEQVNGGYIGMLPQTSSPPYENRNSFVCPYCTKTFAPSDFQNSSAYFETAHVANCNG